MHRFSKKTAAASLFLTAALFAHAQTETRSFFIMGHDPIELKREVTLDTVQTFDQQGHLLSTVCKNGGIDQFYKYDKNGNLIEHTAQDFVQKYTYDKKGKRIKYSNSEGETQVYNYDKNGRLLNIKSSDGTVYGYIYDEKGRLFETNEGDGDTFVYREWYFYDENDRMTSKEVSDGVSEFYTYDREGNIVETNYSDGSVTKAWYGGDGSVVYRVTRVYDCETEEFFIYERYDDGTIKTIKKYICQIYG